VGEDEADLFEADMDFLGVSEAMDEAVCCELFTEVGEDEILEPFFGMKAASLERAVLELVEAELFKADRDLLGVFEIMGKAASFELLFSEVGKGEISECFSVLELCLLEGTVSALVEADLFEPFFFDLAGIFYKLQVNPERYNTNFYKERLTPYVRTQSNKYLARAQIYHPRHLKERGMLVLYLHMSRLLMVGNRMNFEGNIASKCHNP
jgi:hypothetical protein